MSIHHHPHAHARRLLGIGRNSSTRNSCVGCPVEPTCSALGAEKPMTCVQVALEAMENARRLKHQLERP